MKVIKGEKYVCTNGPKKGCLFRVVAFTPYHIACENLSVPSSDVEMIVKYYFKESFREYNHQPMVKIDMISVQQIVFAVNNEIKKYVDGGVISESTFRLMANDVGKIISTEFLEE